MMATIACIGEPISWLRLERYAQGGGDTSVREHVAACPACRQCLDEIERDVVALPPLAVPAPRRKWWAFALPIAGALAAAAVLLLWLSPGEPRDERVASIKGVGDVVLDVVRERRGSISFDARTFMAGDRWKVVVTCPPEKHAWIDVAIVEAGAKQADYPLAASQVACGNRVVLPGAFTLTGERAHRVCVRVAADAAPARALPKPGADGVACLTLTPE